MKRIIKQAGKTTADEAMQVVKKIGQELVEIPKQAGKQLAGVETPSGFSPQQAQSSDAAGSSAPATEPEEKRKLDYLEKELEELKRKKLLQKKQQELAQETAKQDKKPTQLPIQEPTPKPKRGLFSLKKKRGTRELGKRPSG